MKLFHKRKRWYLETLARFNYIASRGNTLDNMVVGRLRGVGEWIKLAASGEIIARFGFDFSILKSIPIEAIIGIPLAIWVWEFLLGLYDIKKLKLFQIEQEIQLRDGINPWEDEKMNRQRDDRRLLLKICQKLEIIDDEVDKIKNKKYETYLEK